MGAVGQLPIHGSSSVCTSCASRLGLIPQFPCRFDHKTDWAGPRDSVFGFCCTVTQVLVCRLIAVSASLLLKHSSLEPVAAAASLLPKQSSLGGRDLNCKMVALSSCLRHVVEVT